METYRRQIKFCYYKVAKIEINENEESHVVGKFNLVEWLMSMKSKALVQRNVKLSDCIVNLGEYKFDSETEIYAIRAYKLRDANIPSKLKEGEDATPIPLDPDEYIGEDINFLYDRKRSICMLQQNRMSIGVSRLAEWINQICPMENYKVAFIPISDKFDANRIGDRLVRTFEISFANFEPDNKKGSLAEMIKSVNKYNGTTAKITISVGREKKAELDKVGIVDLIKDVQDNPGMINSAKIKLKSDTSYSDDDKPRVEIVDLLENAIHDYIAFDIEKKKPLEFTYAKSRMLEKYNERLEKLDHLCVW